METLRPRRAATGRKTQGGSDEAGLGEHGAMNPGLCWHHRGRRRGRDFDQTVRQRSQQALVRGLVGVLMQTVVQFLVEGEEGAQQQGQRYRDPQAEPADVSQYEWLCLLQNVCNKPHLRPPCKRRVSVDCAPVNSTFGARDRPAPTPSPTGSYARAPPWQLGQTPKNSSRWVIS